MIKLKINGREVVTEPGKTVLEAAQSNGISIPSLCAAEGLSSYGGCRLCLVEIKGRRGYVPACCTIVEENLEVTTETPQLRALRRQTLELILSEHPHACLICTEKKNCEDYKSTIRKVGEVTGCVLCPENGQCRLQEVVEELQVERVRFPASYRNFEVHREDPFFDRNYNLCILCARCVRVCAEVRGASAVTVVFRGPQAVIGTALDRPLLDSGCQFCGACVDVCPTGSLTERALKGQGLPDETRSTICPLCSLGCTLEVGLSKGRVVSSYPQDGNRVNHGQACVKGRFVLREVVHSPGRSLRPMLRRHGKLTEASWDEALDVVAQRVTAVTERSLALVVSTQLSLEDQYVAQKFARDLLKVEPVPDSPSLSAPWAFRSMLREHGVSPQLNFELASLREAGAILAAGTDLAVSHPILWLSVFKAVQNGAKLIVLNPGESTHDRWATLTLRAKPGSETTVLRYLTRWLFERRPKNSWASWPGYEDFRSSLTQASQDGALSSAGLTVEQVQSAGRLLDEGRPAFFLCGPGLIGRPHAPGTVLALWNLAQLVEARVIPLAFENNERGLVELWPSNTANGLSPDQVVEGVEKGQFQSLYLAGTLPPLGEKRPDFLVVQDCYRSANSRLADVVLPAATWAEADGTFVNVEGRIQRYRRLLEPLGESKPDWWIFCRLAEKMGKKDFVYQSAAEIAEEMGKMMPALHEASSYHLKKGRPSFVREDKTPAPRFILASSGAGAEGLAPETPGLAGRVNIPDYYRGLNICEEVKGLRRLREKTGPRNREREG